MLAVLFCIRSIEAKESLISSTQQILRTSSYGRICFATLNYA